MNANSGGKPNEIHGPAADLPREQGLILPSVARGAVRHELVGEPEPVIVVDRWLAVPRPLFVTIRTDSDQLRGCIGSLAPRTRNLVDETRANALSAAFRDPRFPPVSVGEIPSIRFEVSVLGESARIESLDELDPAEFGIIVRAASGRHALMLPAIPELDTVERQVTATRRKAGIGAAEEVTIERFRVLKFAE